MATDQIAIVGPVELIERSSGNLTAYFRDSQAQAAATPTNVYWRLDDESGCEIKGWTAGTPDTSLAIAVAAEENAIRNDAREVERKILTVMTDRGLPTQFANSFSYAVRNLGWAS